MVLTDKLNTKGRGNLSFLHDNASFHFAATLVPHRGQILHKNTGFSSRCLFVFLTSYMQSETWHFFCV